MTKLKMKIIKQVWLIFDLCSFRFLRRMVSAIINRFACSCMHNFGSKQIYNTVSKVPQYANHLNFWTSRQRSDPINLFAVGVFFKFSATWMKFDLIWMVRSNRIWIFFVKILKWYEISSEIEFCFLSNSDDSEL